jgi:hypothetical protein
MVFRQTTLVGFAVEIIPAAQTATGYFSETLLWTAVVTVVEIIPAAQTSAECLMGSMNVLTVQTRHSEL